MLIINHLAMNILCLYDQNICPIDFITEICVVKQLIYCLLHSTNFLFYRNSFIILDQLHGK